MTIGEGHTPLLRSRRIGAALGLDNLFFKLETANPTGSYKDRFAASAVSHLQTIGAPCAIGTSSGNTGSALAACCAAAGIPCVLVIVEGAPAGKVCQMQVYGAQLLTVKGFGKDPEITKNTFETLRILAREMNSSPMISAYCHCPEGMQGVETISFELASVKALADCLNVFVPSGGGGLALAIALGFEKWRGKHPGFSMPRIHCVQPAGNDTIAGAIRSQSLRSRPIERSQTRISGLQVPSVLDGDKVLQACRNSGGTGQLVSDEDVYFWQRELAVKEGIFAEPAGAVSLAGAVAALEANELSRDEPVVCVISGIGFKDSPSYEAMAGKFPMRTMDSVEACRIEIKRSLSD